jgi:hypothetical protein
MPKSSMKVPKHISGLVTQSLEHISKDVFSKYASLITKLVEKSSGVYALYDEEELYYVGKATQLRRRVKQHLKDRHDASWTHFSIYLIGNDDHIAEIESLLVRIANPKGNAIKPRGKDSREMRKQLEILIKQKHREELAGLFSKKEVKLKEDEKKTLKRLVVKRTPLYRTYKGKEYKAILSPSGRIVFKGQKFETPTAAAKKITKWAAVNGWRFWYIKNDANEWVKLANYH